MDLSFFQIAFQNTFFFRLYNNKPSWNIKAKKRQIFISESCTEKLQILKQKASNAFWI